MHAASAMNRRRFLQASAATAAGLALGSRAAWAESSAADPYRGLHVGVASYSFRKFDLDHAIAMTKELGLKYINLKDMHLSLKSTKEERQAALKKVTDAGLVMAGGGVIGIKNDAAQVRNVFEYARDAGMPVIVCSPEPEALDLVEQHVKEFNLKIAIHNHGPTDKKYPAPQDALKLIKNRDERMGLCIDVGHTFRIKVDPAAAIRECAARVYDIHLKDVTEDNAKGKATIIGDGVLPIPAVLKALLDIKFTGHVGLEYEVAGDDKAPMEGMKRSLAHIRKCLAEMA